MVHNDDTSDSPDRRPTLTDVAAVAGVSVKTASRVLNRSTTVHPDLAARVQQASGELGYRQNWMASVLRSGKSGIVVLIIRDIANPFYSSIAAGAAEVASEHGLLIVSASSEGDTERQSQLIEQMVRHRPEGILITPAAVHSDPALASEAAYTPVVTMDVDLVDMTADHVCLDNFNGAYSGTLAAVESGCTRFALIMDSYELETMETRTKGAMAALRDRGLNLEDERVKIGSHTQEDAARITDELLQQSGGAPDAIVCGNNRAAVGAAEVLVASGATGTTLISFDKFPLAAVMPMPVIVIDYDPRLVGRCAMELLIGRLNGDPLRKQTNMIPTTITYYKEASQRQ